MKDKARDQVATRIPFEGKFGDAKFGLFATVANLFRHGFIRAFDPTVEGSIRAGNVLSGGKSADGNPAANNPANDVPPVNRKPQGRPNAGAPNQARRSGKRNGQPKKWAKTP